MPTIEDIKRGEKIKALVFGKYKVGKTVGASTFPRPNFIDFDRGVLSLVNPEVMRKYPGRKIQYQTFVEHGKLDKGVRTSHNAFDDACKYFDEWMKPGKVDEFDTWVVDSGTTLIEAARLKAIILLGGEKLSKTFETAKRTGLMTPKMQDFGAERSLVEQFISMVKDTDKHVLFLCHEFEVYDSEGVLEEVVPRLTGGSREFVPLMFDEVWNLRTKKVGTELVRYIQTQPDSVRHCGSRLGVPDGTPFEYNKIISAIGASNASAQA